MFKQLPSFTAKTLSLTVALLLTFGLTYAYATWTEPNTAPPNANAYAPLNTGPTAQTKTGSITSSGDITAKNLKATGDIYTNGGKIYAGSGVYVKQSGHWVKLELGGSNAISLPGPTTFSTPGAYKYTVPAGASGVKIEAWGAQGGKNGLGKGGKGGYVKGVLAVHSGELLRVYVGGQNGYNGGGASDVRVGGIGLNNRIIVAGGGGASYVTGENGGYGGGYVGGIGGNVGYGGGGGGGTQTHGGAGGYNYYCGAGGWFGSGGILDGTFWCSLGSGGAGGGGWYGGGGGYFGAGGGGSSYTGKVSGGSTTSGVRVGNGKVIITPIQ